MRSLALTLGLVSALFAVPGIAHAFDLQDAVRKAQALAKKPYQAPQAVPQFLQDLSFDQYQAIRFKPDKSLWRENHSRFQVMLISPGFYYKHAVALHVIDATGVHAVAYRKDEFTFPSDEIAKRIPPNLGYAGFKLTYPLQGPDVQNQFLVFAGASYFRAVGRNNVFGLSGRGIAVDTGLPSGEEFPSFTEFWLERPKADAHAMKFYGLLDGKSLTGAYQFVVYPGVSTRLQVKAVLFPRDSIKLLGIAPLTSMFYYGSNTPRPTKEWRPQVHDSDGLLLHDGKSGEWLWRPLINPKQLTMDYLHSDNPRGFGLLQRQTQFDDYQDLGARYDERPSAWVKPDGDWGPGNVVLVQLPAQDETSDNIVAFWSPKEPVTGGKPLTFSYAVSFGGADVPDEDMGRATETFVGSGNVIGGGNVEGAYRLLVDFAGGSLARQPPKAPVVGVVTAQEGGKVIEQFVEYVKPTKRWRLSILAKPADGKPLALRAFLKRGDQTLTETWTYRLPADNKVGGGG